VQWLELNPKSDCQTKERKKPKAQNRVSFTLVLLTLMIIVAVGSGMVAYMFGQQALEGVKPVPAGKQVPQPIPTEGRLPGIPTSGLNFSKAING
jgi:flagellar basal body-associated protein FliL